MKDIELKTLKLLLNKDFFNLYGDRISHKILSPEIKSLFKVVQKLHKLSDKNVDLNSVYDMYENSSTVTEAKLQLVLKIIDRIKELPELSPEVTLEIVEKLHEKEAARQIADKALAIMQRNEDAITLQELKDFVATVDVKQQLDGLEDSYTTDVLQIIKDKESKGTFEFKNGLEMLTPCTGKLSRGHFAIVFASTNTGKSSFVAQTSVGFLQQRNKVLYFANEEPSYHIMMNHIRSAEGRSEKDIMLSPLTGQWNSIKENFHLISAHGKTLTELRKYIDKYKPDVIIFDQLDLVQGHTRDKLHETLEKLYQSAREIANTSNALVIAVSQANDEATGKMVLRSQMLANSKIGKPGTADLIIGIGMRSVDDCNRTITLCKNKITGIHESINCVLNNEICRYEP